MKRKHLVRASELAVGLAEEAAARLPYAVPLGDVFAAVWPLALRLERLERKARRDRRRARAHRKMMRRARREVAALLASQPEDLASVPALARSVPFSPDHWRVGLVEGVPVPCPAREAAA